MYKVKYKPPFYEVYDQQGFACYRTKKIKAVKRYLESIGLRFEQCEYIEEPKNG